MLDELFRRHVNVAQDFEHQMPFQIAGMVGHGCLSPSYRIPKHDVRPSLPHGLKSKAL
jgi:hypothetical protein